MCIFTEHYLWHSETVLICKYCFGIITPAHGKMLENEYCFDDSENDLISAREFNLS